MGTSAPPAISRRCLPQGQPWASVTVVSTAGSFTPGETAVLDTPKEEQPGNNGHGSKIIVIPFDGAALDRDLREGSF